MSPLVGWSCMIPQMSKSILVLGCSQRKVSRGGLLPAINRYDGPAFRVLRRYMRENPQCELTVFILSARFGLMKGCTAIPKYDQKLDASACKRLRPQINRALSTMVRDCSVGEILVVASRVYIELLSEGLVGAGMMNLVLLAPPGNGAPLTCLHDWLRGRRGGKHPPRRLNGNSQWR
jgi:hypothetical protein